MSDLFYFSGQTNPKEIMSRTTRAAIYCRVSTKEQKDSGTSPRPGLKKLLTEAERDSLDVLIVYTPDRFNRPKNGRK